MKWLKKSVLIASLFLIASCANRIGTSPHEWCLLDRDLAISHSDTAATQAEVLRHNTNYDVVCPKKGATLLIGNAPSSFANWITNGGGCVPWPPEHPDPNICYDVGFIRGAP